MQRSLRLAPSRFASRRLASWRLASTRKAPWSCTERSNPATGKRDALRFALVEARAEWIMQIVEPKVVSHHYIC